MTVYRIFYNFRTQSVYLSSKAVSLNDRRESRQAMLSEYVQSVDKVNSIT